MNKVEKVSDFKTRFKQAIEESGLKQIELSQKAKCTPSQISSYLKGFYEPKRDKLESLSQVLNVSEMWLLGYDVPKEVQEFNVKFAGEEFYHNLEKRLASYIETIGRLSKEKQESIFEYIDFMASKK